MGWWEIDPLTGRSKSATAGASGDGQQEAAAELIDEGQHLMGDSPLDVIDDRAAALRKSFGPQTQFGPAQVRAITDPNRVSELPDLVRPIVERFWNELDEVYRDQLQRPPTGAERHWCREGLISRLTESSARSGGVPSEMRFDLHVPQAKLWLGILFFGATGVYFASRASGNTQGMLIEGAIHLGVAGATAVWWGLCVMCLAMATVGGIGVVTIPMRHWQVVLDAEAMVAPRFMLSLKPTRVPYREIRDIRRLLIRHAEFLTIVHSRGKLHLNVGYFASTNDFERCRRELLDRTAAARDKA